MNLKGQLQQPMSILENKSPTPWRPLTAWLLLIWAGVVFGGFESRAQVNPERASVTRGLVHWWPNPLDAKDEVTGTLGRVMGVLGTPNFPDNDGAWFDPSSAWVHLEPPITNQVFTLAFWLHPSPMDSWVLLAQESDSDTWMLRSGTNPNTMAISNGRSDTGDSTQEISLERDRWQHVVVNQRSNHTARIWVNGVLRLESRDPLPCDSNAKWITLGRNSEGGSIFQGGIADLRLYDRELDQNEIAELHASGRSVCPPHPTEARKAAQERLIPFMAPEDIPESSALIWTQRQISVDEHLPGNVVTAIHQSKDGFLWVGTDSGLFRFDGLNFSPTFPTNSPVFNSSVYALAESDDGTLWAGTFGSIVRVDGLQATLVTNGPPGRFISMIKSGPRHSLFLLSRRAGSPRGACVVHEFDPDSGLVRRMTTIPGQPRHWEITSTGHWFTTENPGLLVHWDGKSTQSRVMAMIPKDLTKIRFASIPEAPVDVTLRLRRHRDGTWAEIGTGPDGPSLRFFANSRGSWAAFNRAQGNKSWLATADQLIRIRDGVWESPARPEQSNHADVSSLFTAQDGRVWWGTSGDGLYTLAERPVRVYGKLDGLSGNTIRSVSVSDAGKVWVASAEGLDSGDPSGWKRLWPNLSQFSTVLATPEGGLWYSGEVRAPGAIVYRFPSGHEESLQVNGLDWDDPNTIRLDRTGRLWVSCKLGVSRVDLPKLGWDLARKTGSRPLKLSNTDIGERFRRFQVGIELPKAPPLGCIEDRDGNIWVGSLGGGLSRIHGDEVHTYNATDGLSTPFCAPVYCDSKGALWLATLNGLCRRPTSGGFQFLPRVAGWPEDVPLDAIEDDHGHLWVTGRKGIHRFKLSQLEDYFAGQTQEVECVTIGRREGLLSSSCSAYRYPSIAKAKDGTLWVATENGLANLDSAKIRPEIHAPTPYVEKIVAAGKEYLPPPGQNTPIEVRLPPGSGRRLEIFLGAIQLQDPERVRFRYRLEGYDDHWIPSKEIRLAVYTNLKPGSYRFLVEAAGAQNIYHAANAPLAITISPRVWEMVEFKITAFLSLVILLVGINRHQLVKQRKAEQEQHFQNLLSEKARIAADMHDDIGAALTKIAILGEVAQHHEPQTSDRQKLVQRMTQAARETTVAISDLVWATDPHHDNLTNLVARLRERAVQQLEDTGIQINIDIADDIPSIPVSPVGRRNLLLILREGLNNAVKHATATAVTLQIKAQNDHLLLTISDDGRGTPKPADATAGNGMTNMRRRAEEIGGRFSTEAITGEGFVIRLVTPMAALSKNPNHAISKKPGTA